MSSRRRAVVISNDEPDSSYGAGRLGAAFAERFDVELVSPLAGFGEPRDWLSRARADALVLSGSDRSVLAELPWMLDEEEILCRAVSSGVPTLAICFGHQLLAKALGAAIVTREKRIGLFEVSALGGDPVFSGLGDKVLVPEQHADQVVELPAGFELIATSGYCRVQAMRHEALPIYGMQFHPCYDDGVFGEDEAWEELDLARSFVHDGARILGNTVRLLADALP
ncbi:MAG: gamma-glutamyl-gamma-aminobutyrate hydrolase family protein [Candidatus Eisenbacteria bacterium]